jgi:crossover junction endodeoxyribonuclease RuvC
MIKTSPLTVYIGVDPGLNGAVAILMDDILMVHDMPTVEVVRNGKTKREMSAGLLHGLIEQIAFHQKVAILERVGAMPGQGVTSVFSFGRSVGIVEGVLAAHEVAMTIVTPQAWQKAMDVRGGKDASRARAMEVFPAYATMFKRKMDDGRADAALMAAFCRIKHGRSPT